MFPLEFAYDSVQLPHLQGTKPLVVGMIRISLSVVFLFYFCILLPIFSTIEHANVKPRSIAWATLFRCSLSADTCNATLSRGLAWLRIFACRLLLRPLPRGVVTIFTVASSTGFKLNAVSQFGKTRRPQA
jgi:hypothetical protein